MKKILFYIDAIGIGGGAQRVMVNLVNWFAEKDYEVILLNDFRMEDGVYTISQKVHRNFLAENNTGSVLLKNLKRIKKIRKIAKQEKPDLMVSFLGLPNVRMILATEGLPIKKVVSVRNSPEREYGKGKICKKIVGWLFSQADGVVFQTKGAREYFPLKTQEKSVIISNPVGDDFFKVIRDKIGKDIITCGRLEKQKNHKLLIDAFSKICADIPNENLVIYGEGIERKALEEYVKSKGLENRVKLPGEIRDIPLVLKYAKIFVLSSDYEGLPNALMEALAVGVPSISTDCPCGGAADLIENGKTGVLTKVGSAEELASAMKSLILDYEYAQRLGKKAKEKAVRNRIDNIINQWEGYFLKIAETAD